MIGVMDEWTRRCMVRSPKGAVPPTTYAPQEPCKAIRSSHLDHHQVLPSSLLLPGPILDPVDISRPVLNSGRLSLSPLQCLLRRLLLPPPALKSASDQHSLGSSRGHCQRGSSRARCEIQSLHSWLARACSNDVTISDRKICGTKCTSISICARSDRLH